MKRVTPMDVAMLRQVGTSRPNVIHWAARQNQSSPNHTKITWFDRRKVVTERCGRLMAAGLLLKPQPRFPNDSGIAHVTPLAATFVARIDSEGWNGGVHAARLLEQIRRAQAEVSS